MVMKVLRPPNEPLEKFRNLCARVFDDNPEIKKAKLKWPFPLTWSLVVSIVNLSDKDFIKQICKTTEIKAAESMEASAEALSLLQQDFAASHHVLPLSIDRKNKTCTFAVANPVDNTLIDTLRFIYGMEPVLLLASPNVIEEVIQISYSKMKTGTDSALGQLVIAAEGVIDFNENPVVELTEQLIANCILMRASDFHLQPFPGGGVARARVDGMMRRLTLMPLNVYEQLIRYLKVRSGMDIANERTPQDGRVNLKMDENVYEIRVSSLPAAGGERIVMRFLAQNRQFSLSNQRFSLAETQALRKMANSTSGLLLMTGPTGSGKTSTLYAMLNEINDIEKNIITVEDPVEYRLTGISQVNINDKQGLTFASALRSILRQDPDIILVGEIRDEETAQIACQAAMTGHLVLSTLHTNDAISSIPRLMDLNVKPTILASALIGAIAQRLCRKLCVVCRMPVTEPLLKEEQAFKTITKIAPAYRAVGCEACINTGYSGRVPISEIIEINSDIRKAIQEKSVADWKVENNELNNLSALSSSAARHIISGDTSVKEAVRVIGNQFWDSMAKEYQSDYIEVSVFQEGIDKNKNAAPGVLILGFNQPFEDELTDELKRTWFRVSRANSAEQAHQLLETRDNIVHVIVNLSASMSDDQIVEYIREARKELAWSRLPALLLLPPSRDELEQKLIDDGATSPCLMKPVTIEEVIAYSNKAATKVLSN